MARSNVPRTTWKFASSKAQAAVAEKDYEKLLETNKRALGAVPAVEERRAKLDWDRAVLAIEKSGKDQVLAKFEAWTKQAEFEAADLAILRRKIIAPFDGEIVEIEHKQDEWVSPGDEILRLARRDVMHIEGDVAQRDFDPHEVQGCEGLGRSATRARSHRNSDGANRVCQPGAEL